MDNCQKLKIYQAQVGNVRALDTAIRQVRRRINEGLRTNNEAATSAFTKVYAFLFSAWAEANFVKVIHTPWGFDVDEIRQIQSEKANGISTAWKKAVELGLRHLDAQRSSFRPNAQKKLCDAIDTYVYDPSLIRNKLAHGQWVTALNRENTAIQVDLTQILSGLDLVKLDGWRSCHVRLSLMVETLIKSPKKTFVQDWWSKVTELDEAMEAESRRQLSEHIRRLREKDNRTGAHRKRTGAL